MILLNMQTKMLILKTIKNYVHVWIIYLKKRTCCFVSHASCKFTTTDDSRVVFCTINAVIGMNGSKIIWNNCQRRSSKLPCLQHRVIPDLTDTRLDSSSAELCEWWEFVSPKVSSLALPRNLLCCFMILFPPAVVVTVDIVSIEDPVIIEGCLVRWTCFANKLSSIMFIVSFDSGKKQILTFC